MSRHAVDTSPVGTRRPLRVGALALAALMLVYEAQREFGLRAIENIRDGVWR
jgi:hypothetical protein